MLDKLIGGATFFEGRHIFRSHADVSDDAVLRLVALALEHFYARKETRPAFEATLEYVRSNGLKPCYRGNQLIFLAPDQGALARLRDVIRVALVCDSIDKDVKGGQLNIDRLQERQAEKELQNAENVLLQAARKSYKWLLCPVQHTSTDPRPAVEAFALNIGSSALGSELERVCLKNGLMITAWSPIHLRAKPKELYWKAGRSAVGALVLWEDTLRYLYLPCLKTRSVLE
jgi:uncharacterized protein